ncbi:MAG: hypothetical protein DRQ64_05315 [Gammaproteobacteria bacterium]|nr:MAG: hypothetical protein DRQ64_05315 [Gammaproteobacteria bacterium]
MPLHAEFNFKASIPTQRQKIQRLQNFVVAVVAVFILFLASNVIACCLLELLLLLVLIRTRRNFAMGASIESLVVRNKSASAIIDGSHHALSAYGLDYFSSWLAAVRLTTVAGARYCFFVSPNLLGAEKYRELITLLKAKSTEPSRQPR